MTLAEIKSAVEDGHKANRLLFGRMTAMKKPSLTKAELNAVWNGLVYWSNHVAAECIAAGKNPAEYQEHKEIESARLKNDFGGEGVCVP